jgi:hypothetical protein
MQIVCSHRGGFITFRGPLPIGARSPDGRVISRLARRGLKPSGRTRAERGFPVFDVRGDAKPITPKMVRQALDE